MRITQSMLQNNMLQNLFKSQSQMNKYLNQINTGKKIQYPSDDPVIAMKGIGYRTEVTEVGQYQRNSTEVWKWMDHSDDVLDKATKVVQRLDYLAIQAASDTYSEGERKSIAEEVEQLKKQMVELGNTQVSGSYIFNGTDTDVAPIELDETSGDITFQYGNNSKNVEIEVAKGVKMQVNIDPSKVFNDEVFDSINHFKNNLINGGDFNANIDELKESLNTIVDNRASLGARMNRMELIDDRLAQQEIIATDIMMKNEGVEFEEAVTKLLTEEVLHRAALSATAKIIQPSLIDFLR